MDTWTLHTDGSEPRVYTKVKHLVIKTSSPIGPDDPEHVKEVAYSETEEHTPKLSNVAETIEAPECSKEKSDHETSEKRNMDSPKKHHVDLSLTS